MEAAISHEGEKAYIFAFAFKEQRYFLIFASYIELQFYFLKKR